MVGETFQLIITEQFTALRDGDRLWFENGMFDAETLRSIEQTSLSDIIKNNTDTEILQDDVFTAFNRVDLVAAAGDMPPVMPMELDEGPTAPSEASC